MPDPRPQLVRCSHRNNWYLFYQCNCLMVIHVVSCCLMKQIMSLVSLVLDPFMNIHELLLLVF